MPTQRFHSESIYSVNDSSLFVVYIDDSEHSGSSTEFKVTPNGFQLRPDGQGNSILVPVVATEFSMEMYIQVSEHAAFIADLSTSQEGRFKVKVIKNGSLYYVGNIVPDIGSYDDRKTPTFTVKATDLGGLANERHSVDDETPFSGKDTFITHIYKALNFTGLLDFGWSGSDIALSTIDNWYEDSHTVGNANDPLALTRFDHRALYEIEQGGTYKFMTAMDALRQLMQRRGAQLRQSAGRFRVMQLTELDNATPRARHYDKAGTYLSNSADTYTLDISAQDTDGARLAGGQYTWLPILKEVKETYRHRNWVNLIAGATFSGTGFDAASPFNGPPVEAGPAQVNMQIEFTITREVTNISNPVDAAFFEIYRMTVKVGDKYLARPIVQLANYTIQYQSPATWEDVASYYYFHIQQPGPAIGASAWATNTISFTVPQVVESGNVLVNLAFDRFAKKADGASANLTLDSFTATGYMLAVENANQGLTEAVYTATNDTASSTSIALGVTTLIADGTQENTMGRLQVWDGTEWTNSSLWKVGGTGTGYLIQNLLIRSLIALQKTPVRKMVHTVGYAHGYEAHMRLDDGDDIWAFMGGTFTARYNDWQGEWYRVTYSPTEITTSPSVEIPIGTGGITPANTGINIGVGVGITPGHTLPGGTVSEEMPLPDGDGGFNAPPVDGLILGGLAGAQTTATIATGAVTSIPIRQTLVNNAYVVGQQISVIDPNTGINQNFIVSQNSAAGDTSISVTGYAVTDLSPGAYIISTGANQTTQGIADTMGSDFGDPDWWTMFGQWYTPNTTNDPAFPFQSENVGFETDENAGNGSTAGIRFDGDGLQSYTDYSDTPGVKIGLDGKLELNNLDTATGADGLIVENGVVKIKTLLSELYPDWWTLWQQWWYTNETNDPLFPFTAENAGFESDENAGNGSTAGIRFDGDGLTSYTASSATPGVQITTDGKLKLSGLATATGTDGLVLEGGVVKVKTLPTVVTDHGALTGLGDDDHTQYHNDARGDARYYRENEHISTSAGAGSAGKPIVLDAAGHVDATMINDADIDHGSIGGLADDDHTQYHNDARGDARYYRENEHISTSAGAGSAGKPIILDAAGHIDATMINDADIDHGTIGGLTDDDHTQYVLLAGRGVSQTINGATSAGGHLYLKSTSSGTTGNIYLVHSVIGQAAFDFRSNQNAGDGSTAGVIVTSTDGVKAFKSTSSVAVLQIKPTGVMLLDYNAHPTYESNIFYVNNGVIHLDVGGDGGYVRPQYGHIRHFTVISINSLWTTGTKDVFWKVTSEYAGYEVHLLGFGVGTTGGTGAGSNQCILYHSNAAGSSLTAVHTMTCNSTASAQETATNIISLTAGDYFYFNVSAIRSTPAQGLYVELYLRKTA